MTGLSNITDTGETEITQEIRSEGTRITLQNREIRLVAMPEWGGKIVSIERLESGHEFLLQPAHLSRARNNRFEDHAFGFDDCFPTVTACEYPHGPFQGTMLPDHGELWARPWKHQASGGHLLLSVKATALPCTFQKRIALRGDTVLCEYELESLSDHPFYYLWSAHPLLNVREGCNIILGSGVAQVMVGGSKGKRLGQPGDLCSWPVARIEGREIDLSVIGPVNNAAEKLFAGQLLQGSCSVHDPVADETISLHFDTTQTPYLGIWLCQGGWPEDSPGHFTAALEPCTGRPDSLAEAIERQECAMVLPRQKNRWSMQIRLHRGRPSPSPISAEGWLR
ncbi:MAG TPA: hypothetical protein VKZ53_05080 [Candidatus Angelobacter sp.]|nr:hypothetical protein [Candidatus Angelobacter sp.]